MKKILLSIFTTAAMALSTFGQAPEGFKYQAVVRDAGNAIIANQAVGIQLTIQQGSAGGTAIYTETFAPTTNAYGLVNLEIGTGTTLDDFTTIDWSNGTYFIETAIDASGGSNYSVMGTSQLMSVPYALYAKTSGNGIGPAGVNGLSTYDLAYSLDSTIGTSQQWLASLAGLAGANGVDGADGIDGPAGADGTPGQDGINGQDGAPGIAGTPGQNGINGQDGTPGIAGTPGQDGINGTDGADGTNGIDGTPGIAGNPGPAGAPGNDGAPGQDGAPGPPGPTGPAGADGATGPAGADGATGPAGGVGPAGPTGGVGPTGADGNDGATGPAGSTGVTGPAGAVGATGAAGSQGLTGSQGSTGPAGADGTNGTNGNDGATGAAGSQGLTGSQGSTGPAGTSYTQPTYTINTFYAELGGYVIAVRDGGKHGLVVAMQDQGFSSWYGANDLLSDANNHDVTGAKFMDWRLPTKRELNLVYNQKLNIGGFSPNDYWSSSEYGYGYAWSQNFVNGSQVFLYEVNSYYVRSVRAF